LNWRTKEQSFIERLPWGGMVGESDSFFLIFQHFTSNTRVSWNEHQRLSNKRIDKNTTPKGGENITNIMNPNCKMVCNNDKVVVYG